VTDHPRKGRAKNHHEKSAKAEHRARENPRRGSEGDEELTRRWRRRRRRERHILCSYVSGSAGRW